MPTPEPLEQLAMEWPEDDVEPRLPVSAAPVLVEVPAAPVADVARVMAAAPDKVLVATDGSCLRNPGGPTGWAASSRAPGGSR